MKAKINFKYGFFTGIGIGILLLLFGYYSFQKIAEKAENVATIDLHQLEYQDLEGNTVTLSDYEDKHLLVNFWATWCAPCVKEFPVLDETYTAVEDNFVFIMVSDESIDKIKAFAAKKPYQFVYLKTDNLIVKGITYVPHTFVLDKDGITKFHHPTIFEGNSTTIASTLYKWIQN